MKALVTIAVNDYRPEICALTFPNLKEYADRIGAEFLVVRERKFPTLHPAYEKMQLFEIAERYEKTLLVDADIALHPRLPDLIEPLPMDGTGSWMGYDIVSDQLTLWKTDHRFFQRDGRNLGIVGSMVACTKWTRDIFRPLDDQDPHEMQEKIYRPAIIDEYVMSFNLAKYGLKHFGLWQSETHGIYHAEATTKNEKDDVEKLKKTLDNWRKL